MVKWVEASHEIASLTNGNANGLGKIKTKEGMMQETVHCTDDNNENRCIHGQKGGLAKKKGSNQKNMVGEYDNVKNRMINQQSS